MTIRQYLMRRCNLTVRGTIIFAMVAGYFLSEAPVGFVLRFVFGVLIAAVVLAAVWSLFEVPCLNCRKALGAAGFWAASGSNSSRDCPHCHLSLDEERVDPLKTPGA